MAIDVFQLIRFAAQQSASDLQLVVGTSPLIRVFGALNPMTDMERLTEEEVIAAFSQLTTPEERDSFHKNLELDWGYTLPGVVWLRCNAAQQQNGLSLALRLFPPHVPTIEEFGLPQIYNKLAEEPRGLLVLSGPTDSGKSTTLAAMVNHLNILGGRNIVTIEDPIEFVHTSINGAITQRQVGRDTLSFAFAMKHVLRQNPDVILLGEMRDVDTAAAVLSVAETGHLIFTTSHASSTHQAVERIIDYFPPHERHLAQSRLASLLIGVACQLLVPRVDGSGRVAAVEILMANAPVRNLIRDGKIYQLPNTIRTGRDAGMMSLDDSLVDLYRQRIIDYDTLFANCVDRDEVEELISTGGMVKPSTRRK
jgi:twitching motility protein PilT